MYTFVFMATRTEALSHDILRNSARITRKWMPTLGIELVEGYTLLPGGQSGWFWLAPAGDGNQDLVSEYIDERYAVLVFGNISGCGSCNAARTVFDAWDSGGSPKIRELEGCFSAVIVDRTGGPVLLIGDLMGRRALSYFADDRVLLASPHDVALMSTGRIPVEFDHVSVCSVAAFDWSLRGKSLLKHVNTCHPAEYIRWADGQIHHIADPVLNPSQRISAGDHRSISDHLNQMIERAQTNARVFVGNRPEFKCDLSAGLDSRAVWSLLVSVVDNPSRIIATSVGEVNNVKVKVASRLAKMYGTGFASYAEPAPSGDDFLARCDLLAFSMNGGTPGKRAMKYPKIFRTNPQTYA